MQSANRSLFSDGWSSVTTIMKDSWVNIEKMTREITDMTYFVVHNDGT